VTTRLKINYKHKWRVRLTSMHVSHAIMRANANNMKLKHAFVCK